MPCPALPQVNKVAVVRVEGRELQWMRNAAHTQGPAFLSSCHPTLGNPYLRSGGYEWNYSEEVRSLSRGLSRQRALKILSLSLAGSSAGPAVS